MSWLSSIKLPRWLCLPKKLNSGGDLVRLYKDQLFAVIDKLDDMPEGAVLSDYIISHIKLNSTQKMLVQIFLMGVVESALKYADGKIDLVQAYLKNYILTCK